jgi:hypothetical protein
VRAQLADQPLLLGKFQAHEDEVRLGRRGLFGDRVEPLAADTDAAPINSPRKA